MKQSPCRRLAVLRSHLQPPQSPLAAAAGGGGDEQPAAAAASAEVFTSSCAASTEPAKEEGGGKDGCVFCRIIRGESPAFKLYEDDVSLCILDSNPLTFGHSLIIPKCHFPSLEATPPPVVAAMCSKVPFLSNAIMKATQCDAFNLVVNNGKAAGQVIFHTHFHIIPRKAGDKLWPSESFRRHSLERNQATMCLVSCIKELLFSSFSGDCKADGSILPKEL